MVCNSPHILLFLMCVVLGSSYACSKYFGSSYGSAKLPGRSCTDILRQRCNVPTNGIYWIALAQNHTFPVFCDMEAGGWTLVFKLVAGVPGRPATTWNMPFSTYEYSLPAVNTGSTFRRHYKNRIVQNWNVFNPSEARVVLYKLNKEELSLRFKTTGSNNRNWFSQANILESPWQDILTATKNYFTVDGPCWSSGCRDFHINHAYGGCPNDSGWLSVGNAAECKWETRHASGVKLVYSKIATKANYNHYGKFDAADVFAVFLR